ncbi:MAG: inositol monophosphatase family protein [Actinomycetales bacterium]
MNNPSEWAWESAAASDADVELATRLIREAGDLAARMRAEGVASQRKSSVSDIVTAADHAAERLIVDTLAAERPCDGVRGEEGSSRAGSSGRRWVIDPVDGTWNFHSGMDYWCCALALVDARAGEGQSVAGDGADLRGDGEDLGDAACLLGAVYRPATRTLWLGGPGRPTTENAHPVPGVVQAPLAECSLGTYIAPGAPDDPAIFEPLRSMLAGVATPRVLGSGSVDLAGVASGRLGCWAQHSCPEWDWLPGAALVRAAGGVTATLQHRGLTWYLAGGRAAVDELADRLCAG